MASNGWRDAIPGVGKDSIQYHDLTGVFFLIILFLKSNHGTTSAKKPVKLGPPAWRRATMALACMFMLSAALFLLGCTPGNLSESSTGWSPIAAAPIPATTGSLVDEGGTFSPLDNLLTVTDPNPFVVGHVLQIGAEQMRITAITFRDLGVARGANGTLPAAHPDRSEVLLLAGDLAIYIGTKQGSVKGLRDDGSGLPAVEWTYSPVDPEQ